MEKKYSDLYEQHLGNVTKIEELKGKVTQVRAKLNSCCNDVLDIVTEIDALKKRSDHLHFTQMQVDIVRQLRSENERLKKTISDMTTASRTDRDTDTACVEDLEAQSVLEGEMAEACAQRIDTPERELESKETTFTSRCSKLKGNHSRLTELHPVCPEAQALIDEIVKAAESLEQ
ncbi:hypothetical protein N0V91_005975 [Didymella pomorum]|uniref:Uncharacterized protein n=1 Tax=Didymella pomorum TaxID=749634 RepID=A0A9W8ZBT1_9PLEO|nr:hypothetical protein N0V91_005975 [Didymella pomorum]